GAWARPAASGFWHPVCSFLVVSGKAFRQGQEASVGKGFTGTGKSADPARMHAGGQKICPEKTCFLPLAGKKRNILAGEGEAKRSQPPVRISLQGRRHSSASLQGSYLGPVLFSVVVIR